MSGRSSGMRIILVMLASALSLLGDEPPKKFDKLETLNGKVYEKVEVRKIEPDGISIIHDAGTAKVMFENLPKALQDAYQFDPGKAAEHREQTAKREASEYASQVSDATNLEANEKIKKSESQLLESIKKAGVSAWLEVIQNPGGELCLCIWGEYVSRPIVDRSGLSPKVTGHQLTDSGENEKMIAVIGLGDVADGQKWRGVIYPCGIYTYDSVGSGAKTVKRYATTPQVAMSVMMR